MVRYVCFFLFLISSFLVKGQENTITTDDGAVQGTQTSSGIQVFKGIPFAAPPVGELRWKAPQPVKPWDGVLSCTVFGPSPIQGKPEPFMFWSKEFLIPEEPIEEDCLYLNVWTKGKDLQPKKPVLVYIYGGGFRSGGSGCPIYDGTAMAEKDLVFVSFNYRVGVFGFLAHPELTQESGNSFSGNYALLDMIAALKWVKQNIAAFGGDPNNVTIAGQSAGAFAVNYLTVSPLAKGLFHKAIAESGAQFYNGGIGPQLKLNGAEKEGVAFAEALGCKTIAELRSKSAGDILKAKGGTNAPIVDGYVIPEAIYDSYKQGRQTDVPLLLGWNKEDIVFMKSGNAQEFKSEVQQQFGDLAPLFLKEYPSDSDERALLSQRQMGRDQIFGIQMFTWANMQSAKEKSQTYVYNFNRQLPAYDSKTQFGAFHSGEIVYAYDNLNTLDRPWEAIDYKIAGTMSSYWANFARSGDPNRDGLPYWPAYNQDESQVMVFDKVTTAHELPDKSKLLLWTRYFESLH